MMPGTSDAGENYRCENWRAGTGLNLEFWGPPRYGDLGILLRKPSRLQGACPTLPSWRGEGGATRCKAAGPEKPEVYSLEYIEDFFGPRTTQMVAGRSPQ